MSMVKSPLVSKIEVDGRKTGLKKNSKNESGERPGTAYCVTML